jgi:hypothetical protein
MNRSLHKLIGLMIAQELKFSVENTAIFVEGCLGPDSHGDFPHEGGKDKRILSLINEARDLYFLNDEFAFGKLGNALHYIEDKWVRNGSNCDERILNFESVLKSVDTLAIAEESKSLYKSMVKNLSIVKNCGVEAWFDHNWGIWHRDYASCVYVFADIIEMMLPSLAPNLDYENNQQELQDYFNSKTFEKATKEGFLSSLITNYLYPKLSGYSAAIYCLATVEPPATTELTNDVNLSIASILCLEISRYTLMPTSVFKFEDSWTNGRQKEKQISLAMVIPEYHTLIPRPVTEIQRERNLYFYEEGRRFVEEWPKTKRSLDESNHSQTWKIILLRLVEMLG